MRKAVVAGCRVKMGSLARDSLYRITRNGKVIFDGKWVSFSYIVQTWNSFGNYMYLVISRRLALTSGGSRPSDKAGGGDGGQPKKFFLRPFRPHFGLKIRGAGHPPLDPPLLTLPSPKRKLLLYPQLLTTTILGDI